MSETKQPYKWYWAFENEGLTWICDSLEEARNLAIYIGMFAEICSKEAFMAYEEELFFEVREDDLEDYLPYLFAPKEQAA